MASSIQRVRSAKFLDKFSYCFGGSAKYTQLVPKGGSSAVITSHSTGSVCIGSGFGSGGVSSGRSMSIGAVLTSSAGGTLEQPESTSSASIDARLDEARLPPSQLGEIVVREYLIQSPCLASRGSGHPLHLVHSLDERVLGVAPLTYCLFLGVYGQALVVDRPLQQGLVGRQDCDCVNKTGVVTEAQGKHSDHHEANQS